MNEDVIIQQIGPGRPGFDPGRPIHSVPEPNGILLVVIGLAIFALIRYRKQWRSRNVPVKLTDLYR
jgi:hypothetical protein